MAVLDMENVSYKVFEFIKKQTLICKQGTRIKNFLSEFDLALDDIKYKKAFKNNIGPVLYKKHVSLDYISCVFCNNLSKSMCHDYCFSCSKKSYKECSILLPGTFPFTDKNLDSLEYVPWLFKKPCTAFERIEEHRYFKHLNSISHTITISSYEILEGVFKGFLHGKKPCHICASVDIDIYNKCIGCKCTEGNKPCSDIMKNISSTYQSSCEML